jgi:hypothetical protein
MASRLDAQLFFEVFTMKLEIKLSPQNGHLPHERTLPSP